MRLGKIHSYFGTKISNSNDHKMNWGLQPSKLGFSPVTRRLDEGLSNKVSLPCQS